MPAKPHKIDIGEDLAQQRKLWRIEKFSWALGVLVLLAALLGLLGHGYLSERVVSSAETGLIVTYNRFERYHAQTALRVELPVAGAQTRLRLGAEFLDTVEVARIEPEPERVELDTGFNTYVLNTAAAGTVTVYYTPHSFGPLQIDIALEDGTPLVLPQFVFP